MKNGYEVRLQEKVEKYRKEIGIPVEVELIYDNPEGISQKVGDTFKKYGYSVSMKASQLYAELSNIDAYVPAFFPKSCPVICINKDMSASFKKNENWKLRHELGHIKDNVYSGEENNTMIFVNEIFQIRNDEEYVNAFRGEGFKVYTSQQLIKRSFFPLTSLSPIFIQDYQERIFDWLVDSNITDVMARKELVQHALEENENISEKFSKTRFDFERRLLAMDLAISELHAGENNREKFSYVEEVFKSYKNITEKCLEFFPKLNKSSNVELACKQIEDLERIVGMAMSQYSLSKILLF